MNIDLMHSITGSPK